MYNFLVTPIIWDAQCGTSIINVYISTLHKMDIVAMGEAVMIRS